MLYVEVPATDPPTEKVPTESVCSEPFIRKDLKQSGNPPSLQMSSQ